MTKRPAIFVLILCLTIAFSISAQQDNAPVSIDRLNALFQKGKYKEVLDHGMVIPIIESDSNQWLQITSTSAYRLGQFADAKRLNHLLINRDSTNQQALSQLAGMYDTEYNLPKAIKYYSKLLATDTTNAYYHRKYAMVNQKAGFKQEQFWHFARAYKLNPKDVVVVSELVDLLLESDQFSVADSVVDQALLIDSTNIKLIFTQARSKYKQKEYGLVPKAIEKTFGRIDLPEYYTKILGFSYLQIDSIDKAIYRLEQLIHSQQKEFIHYYLAIAYGKKGDAETSLFHYENAIKKSISENLNIYFAEAALIHEKAGRKAKAIENYKQAYEYAPRSKYVYHIATLSDLYYKDKSIAIRYYNQYASMNKTHPPYLDYAKKRAQYLKEHIHQARAVN